MQPIWKSFLYGCAILAALLAVPTLQAQTLKPCTHWASPGGSATSSQCSDAAPCKIMTWLNSAAYRQPGKVLCLKDGTYTGSDSMISIPDGFAGTAENPITIRAINPGKVTIDGQDSLRPINTKGSYGVITGVNAVRGDNENVMVRGDHWFLKDMMTWNVGTAGDSNIHLSGTDNTIEDCGSWGPARKAIEVGAAGGDRNVVRRCWARWEANLHETSNPSNAIEMGYGQNTVTMENTIATWDTKGRVTAPEGIAQIFSTQGSRWLGSIFYLTREASFNPSRLLWGTTDTGSHAQQGDFNPTSNLLFKHILAYIDPQHAKFSSVRALYFTEGTDDGAPPGTGNVLTELTTIAGVNNTFSSSFPTTKVQYGRSVSEAIGAGKSVWTDSFAAPGICKRYVKGQLTTQGLWPFPADKRISDALVQSGYPAMSVTATMEQLFGPIPEECRTTGGTPTPPAVMYAPTDLGIDVRPNTQLLVKWLDTRNTQQVGYTLERRTKTASDTTEYAVLTTQLSPSARDWLDTAPVMGTHNCYVVSTRGATSTSGRSEEVCHALGTDPMPPEPPTPSSGEVVCTGDLLAGGKIELKCTPQAPQR